MQVHELFDEIVAATDRARNNVGHAADELGDAVHDDIGTERSRAQNQRTERVVDDELQPGLTHNVGQSWNISDPKCRI